MLKRLYIDNFRCFVNFEYKPERKQLLLGANGSGKSSLLDAIQALKEFLRKGGGDRTALRVLQSGRTRGATNDRQTFEMEVETSGDRYIYRVEFFADGDLEHGRILEETMRKNGQLVISSCPEADVLFPQLHRLANEGNESVWPFYDWVAHQLDCFRINPFAMTTEGKLDTTVHPKFDLSDVASWYLRLLQIGDNSDVQDSAKEVLDGLIDFEPGASGHEKRALGVRFKLTEGDSFFKLTELSEGQRSLIGLHVILHNCVAKGHTVFLDEPDNFISLREIQPWLLQADAAVDDSKGQLILISHHPEILNQWAQEYGLRFFREENGHVRTEKFKPDPDGFLQPSELIARGWENE